MKTNLFSTLCLLALTLLLKPVYASGTNDGSSCANAIFYQVNQTLNFSFEPGQSELYFEFTASYDSLLLLFRDNHLGQYANINQVEVYEKINCNNLNLVYNVTVGDSSASKDYFEIPNLNPGHLYQLVVKRDPMQPLPPSNFQMQVIHFIIASCIDTRTCYQLINNGDFTYTTTDPVRSIDPFDNKSPVKSQVCSWKQMFGTPQLVDKSGNSFVKMWSAHLTINFIGESIKTSIDLDTSETYHLKFQLKKHSNKPFPTSFKAKLASTIGGPYSTNFYAEDTVSTQEVAVVLKADMTSGWETYYFCFKPKDPDYDVIYFFPYDKNPALPQSYILFDKVSLEKYSSLGVKDSIVIRNDLCEDMELGKECYNPHINYAWISSVGLNDSTSHNPILDPTYTGTYTANMTLPTVAGSCPISQQITVSNSYPELPGGTDIAWGGNNINEINYNTSSGNYESNNATFFIAGDFTVDQDWTLTGCKIFMGEDAKITVTNGAVFKFDGALFSSFIKSCGDQWDGIYADGSSRIEISEAHPFENSDNGITLIDGADLVAEKVEFKHNKRCIYSSSQVAARNQEFDVNNCTFESTSRFPLAGINAFYPQVAIQLNDMKSSHNNIPRIYSNNFKGTGGNLTLIHGDSIEIKYNIFEDFYNDGLPPYPYNATIATNAIVLYGVTSINDSMPNYNFRSNNFYKTTIGIRAYDQMNFYSLRNAFNATLDNNLDTLSTRKGVKGCTYFKASNNYHPNRKGSIALHVERIYRVYSGIEIYNSDVYGGVGGIIQCEKNVGGKGVTLDNSNLPTKGSTFGVSIHQLRYANQGVTYTNAKVLEASRFLDVSTYTPPPDDCSNPSAPCPCFNPPCTFPKQSGYGKKMIASIYREHLNSSAFGPHLNPSIFIPDLDIEGIVSEYSDVKFQCLEIENFDVGMRFEGLNTVNMKLRGEFKNCYFDMVLNNYGEIGIQEVDNVTGIGFLWDKTTYPHGLNVFCSNNTDGSLSTLFLKQNPLLPRLLSSDLTSSDIIVDSSATKTSTTYCPNLRLTNGNFPTVNIQAYKGKHWINRQKNRASIIPSNRAKFEQQLAYWLIKGDSALNADTSLKIYRDSLSLLPFGRLMSAQKNRDSLSSFQRILTIDKFDQDVKLVSSLNNKVVVRDSLSKQEMYQLNSLASSCPYEKGVAVYQARNVLGQLGVHYYINSCETYDTTFTRAAGKRIKSNLIQKNTEVLTYPNPAKNQLTIEYGVKDNTITGICFFDVLGKKVHCESLVNGIVNTISTSNLKNGIYFYRIEENGRLIQKGKQIIQK